MTTIIQLAIIARYFIFYFYSHYIVYPMSHNTNTTDKLVNNIVPWRFCVSLFLSISALLLHFRLKQYSASHRLWAVAIATSSSSLPPPPSSSISKPNAAKPSGLLHSIVCINMWCDMSNAYILAAGWLNDWLLFHSTAACLVYVTRYVIKVKQIILNKSTRVSIRFVALPRLWNVNDAMRCYVAYVCLLNLFHRR